MQAQLIAKLIGILITKLLTPELLRKLADSVLDFAEEYVLGSASEVDDEMVLPLCSMIRTTFDIPDTDKEKPPRPGIHEGLGFGLGGAVCHLTIIAVGHFSAKK